MKKITCLVSFLMIMLFESRAMPQDIFHDCGMEGSTNNVLLKEINNKKNRYNISAASDINDDVTFISFI